LKGLFFLGQLGKSQIIDKEGAKEDGLREQWFF
jgi:hypothetical protein